MSTRSMIFITGLNETTAIYKHSDGYPTDNLRIIAEALDHGNSLVMRSNTKFGSNDTLDHPGTLVGCIIGAATTIYGMGAVLEEIHNDSFKHSMSNHGDVEWVYVIDLHHRTLKIYRDGSKETTDPIEYVKDLQEDSQDNEVTQIKMHCLSIRRHGYKIN